MHDFAPARSKFRAASPVKGLGLLLLWCAAACSGASQKPADPGAAQSLEKAKGEHQQVMAKLAAASPKDRQACEIKAGDCLMLGGERRDTLIKTHDLLHCQDRGTAADETACIIDALAQRNEHKAAAEYYGFETWCSQKLLACTADLQAKAEIAARKARFEERRQQQETRPEAIDLWVQTEFAKEKVNYLRSTLPPKGKEMCKGLEPVAACFARVEQQRAEFEAELDKDQYDPERAASLYAAAKKTEASCPDPEFQCIVKGLQSYGALPETRKWLDKNLKVLERRQELLSRVNPEFRAECLADTASSHQPQIVDAYQIYTKQPVMFFRSKLERAFLAMHEAQVYCLDAKQKTAGADKAGSGQ